MNKVVLTFLIVIILVMGLNTASALTQPPPYFSLLLTDYRNVDTVTFVLTDANGDKTKEVNDNARDAERTKIFFERIHNFSIRYMDVEYNDVEGGSFVVTVKTKDGKTYISGVMDGSRLFEDSDYVFDTELGEFEDREIESRLSDRFLGFVLAICLFFFYLVVFAVKSILGQVYTIKPLGRFLLVITLFNILSIVFIEIYYLYVLTGIWFVIIGIMIAVAVIEYKVLNKIAKHTLMAKKISYVVISNIVEIAGALLMIVFVVTTT